MIPTVTASYMKSFDKFIIFTMIILYRIIKDKFHMLKADIGSIASANLNLNQKKYLTFGKL